MGNAKSSGKRQKTIRATLNDVIRAGIGGFETTMMTSKVTMEDFELMKVVGRGSYGKVYMVKHKNSGELFALKALKKDVLAQRGQIEHTKSERRILEMMDHPFIVSL